MSYFNTYAPIEGEKLGPPPGQTLATEEQIRAYDKVKRKNNGLIIGLVIIILLLVAAIVAIFVLLYTPSITIPTTAAPGITANTLKMALDVEHSGITYDAANYADRSQNAFNGLENVVCRMIQSFLKTKSREYSDCKVTKMSPIDAANLATGLKMEAITLIIPVGTAEPKTVFADVGPVLTTGFKAPYSVKAATVKQIAT